MGRRADRWEPGGRGRRRAAVVLAAWLAACGPAEGGRPGSQADSGTVPEGAGVPGTEPGAPRAGERTSDSEAARPAEGTEQDWAVFRQTVAWAYGEGLDTAPVGEAVARFALRFVDATYTPHTLELPGPERVVVNLEEFDCVTLVENALALARFVRTSPPAILDDAEGYRARYRGMLADLRYRGGVPDAYPSRLHYFSEWIADNHGRANVRDVTRDLGGVPDSEPVDFMSRHPEAYRPLADASALEAIRAMEERLSAGTRHYIPQERIAELEPGIRNGDVIAATSTVPGLDVAHTGIAYWLDGRLHLVHAPLVGRVVEISEVPLAERIASIRGQDGIMVARPLEPRQSAAGGGAGGRP